MSKSIPVLFLKSHIDTFTRKDGAVVAAHDDSRIEAKPHPSGKHVHGDHVFFPHPDPKKKGKNALGRYMGHANGKSVVKHEQGGDKLYQVAHEDVKHARGMPKTASTADTGMTVKEFRASEAGHLKGS